MNDNILEPLLEKAKELEKKYEWLQAGKCHQKVADVTIAKNDAITAADLTERVGFCFYRASLQAQSNAQFRTILKQSILAYERVSMILEGIETEECEVKRIHADALTHYARSWYETDPKEKRKLLDRWWNLEKQVLEVYERSGNFYFVGKTCNDLLEYSGFDRYWLASNFLEHKEMYEECLILGEKAIQIFSELDDKYELSRAYLYSVWYYAFSRSYEDDEEKIIQISQKCQQRVNKALELSQEIGDAVLIGRCYQVSWAIATHLTFDIPAAIEFGKKMLEFGKASKNNTILGFGNWFASTSMGIRALVSENPDEKKELAKKAITMAKKAKYHFQIINHIAGFLMSYQSHIFHLERLASIETDPKRRQELLETAIEVGQEGLRRSKGWKRLSGNLFNRLSTILLTLSLTESVVEEKKELLRKAQSYSTKYLAYLLEMNPIFQITDINRIDYLVQIELAKMEPNFTKKMNLLTNALKSCERSINVLKKREKSITQSSLKPLQIYGNSFNNLGETLQQINSLTKKKEDLYRAIEAYKQASVYYEKAGFPIHIAESYWHLAQLCDQADEFQEASRNYESTSKAYDMASKKIAQLKDFYGEYSLYMQAWSQIELAKYSHSIEDYETAKRHYEEAAKLHESTSLWSYLAPNYLAWSYVEEAESLSRKESTEQAKQTFQEALQNFSFAEKSIKQKLEEITSDAEKGMAQKLLQASDLRRKYCQARILMEEAKLLDREGKYLQSSRKYGEAKQKISTIIDKTVIEAEKKEIEYIIILCQAWEKMATAEEATSSESYLEAADLFEQAKDRCHTKKASLWTLGNSNFCKGLAAGVRYQESMDLKENAIAKRYIKSAASSYVQAGFKSASEYAKATQRLFDAYVFMNQVESEVDPDKKARQYQMAENLLQIAMGSFMKAKQPEKTAQVQQILNTVREEKKLVVSLNEVMHAPSITSSTLSFTAPTPTNEVSVGLEQFQHANVQANLIAGLKDVKVGESFCLTVEFVNAGKEPALLTRVEDFIPPDFIVVKRPEICRLEGTCLNMKGKQIAPLKLVEAKLVLQPSKKGVYQLKPRVHYLDELGQNKSLQLKSVEIKVEEVVLADRISTGTKELDSLLLGGIPEGYAVVLTGSPSDERERIIKNFLKAGAKEGQNSFYVTAEAIGLANLLEKPGFYLFLCNPKPKITVPDRPNVYRLLGKTDLTNLNIALLKAYRSVEESSEKRGCLDIVSDVLLHHGAETTRRWISELITDMVSKGFTVLAVLDPSMHPSDQANAILNLFDGEISLYQIKDPLECKKSIRVKKLRNQDYIKNPICLT